MAATGAIYIGAGTIGADHLSSTERWRAAQVVHELNGVSVQAPGTNVTAKTEIIHIARAAGSIGTLKVAAITAPTGGNNAFSVDLQKSTGGGAFSSVLSAAYVMDNSKTSLTTYSISPSVTTYAAGDIFEVVWLISGSTGNQAQGAVAEAFFEEATS
jgi:hypothetical protein